MEWAKILMVWVLLVVLALPVVSAQRVQLSAERFAPVLSDFTNKVSYAEPEVGKLEFSDVAAAESISMGFLGKDAVDNEIPIDKILDFKITVDSSMADRYKWSYEFALPDDKFVPEIWVTGNSAEILYGKYVLLNKKYLVSFDDVLDFGFKYELRVSDGKSVLVILTKDWASEGIKVGDKVLIDPTITSYPHDGYIGIQRTGTYTVDISNTPMYAGNDVGGGDADWFYRVFMRFNMTAIDPWDIVINATFWARVSAKTCGSGSSRFWLQNISDYGALGIEDWNSTYQNISVFFYANENSTGWHSVNATNWIAKGGMTAYRLVGTYEDYDGVDCFINVNSNESVYEPYLEVWWTDGSPVAPNITIVSPANATYQTDVMNLSVMPVGGAGGIDKWWYSLNGAPNVTFTPNTTFTASLGANCIDVYLNNTYGSVSTNRTCFTVASLGSNLMCYASPQEAAAGQNLYFYCNYSYLLNGTPVAGASCNMTLNDTVIVKRFYGFNSEEALFGESFGGFGIQLPTSILDIGGGAYMRCTGSTSSNFTIYQFVSADLPFISLNGTMNITSVNYTELYGSFSCDYLDSLFGIKGETLKQINLPANMSLINDKLALLGNPPLAYFGFYGGCENCTGGNDSFFIGVNTHNFGYTYHGNLSQTDNWQADGYEHAHWLYINVPSLPMTYNSSAGLYNLTYATNQWFSPDPSGFDAFGNCTAPNVTQQVDDFKFNISATVLPTCSVDAYLSIVVTGFNQTFTWSKSSPVPFMNSSVQIVCNSETVFLEMDVGTFSVLMNESGACSIMCSVSNVAGTGNDTVGFVVQPVAYVLHPFYKQFVEIGEYVRILGFVVLNGTSVNPVENLTFRVENTAGNMTWNSTLHGYEIVWIPSSLGIFNFTMMSSLLPDMLIAYGNISVVSLKCINVTLWTNVSMPPSSKYVNEWAWVYAVRQLDPSLTVLFGKDRYSCPPQGDPECYWHGRYAGGTASICLPYAGNYTLYMIGNNIEWNQVYGDIELECYNCKPTVIKQRLLYNLGTYYFNSDESMDLYLNPTELQVFGGIFGVFASWLWVGIFGLLCVLTFIFTLWATSSLKSALAIMVFLPTIIYLIIAVVLGH